MKKKKPNKASLKKKAQYLFNRFIRERDKLSDAQFQCISCRKTFDIKYAQAGHFFGTKSYNWMRFNEDNCNIQCPHCNGFAHESLIGYCLSLPLKIGQKRFQALMEESFEKKPDFTIEELEAIIKKYTIV